MSSRRARTFLKELRAEIESHAAVNHLFLNRISTSPFSREDYRVFAENHFPLVCVFTQYLENLLLRGPDSGSKLWLAKVLVDEYGEGSDGKDHSTLYAKFLEATGSSSASAKQNNIPQSSHAFISTHLNLVRTRPFLEGLGAVGPGHEWAIPKMFDAVIPGLRRAGFTEDEIMYFTLHVEQDDDHGRWLEEALAQYAVTDTARGQIRRGTLISLKARGEFWSAVQRAIVTFRQPRSIRQDGVDQRGPFKELALTGWDALKFTGSLERWFARRQAHRRPTLESLVTHP